jgi:hypothetical protein
MREQSHWNAQDLLEELSRVKIEKKRLTQNEVTKIAVRQRALRTYLYQAPVSNLIMNRKLKEKAQ